MKYWLLLVLIIHTPCLLAQHILTLNGNVLDAYGQPVPLAHVSFKKFFTAADADGKFKITIAEKHFPDTLTVTAVGFVNYHIAIKRELLNAHIVVVLEPEIYPLDAVTISNQKARNHWMKALQKLDSSRLRTAYTYPAYFRQVHQENGTYVRLIEAGMMVYDVAATYQAGILQERFSLQQVRRSNVTERNGDQHGDHLVDMFMENSLRYPTGTILDAKSITHFDITFADSECTNCGDSLEMLAYQYQHADDPKTLNGKIWLYNGTMKLFALEETATRNPQYRVRGISMGSGDHHWMFQESHKALHFGYVDGKIYLSNLHFEYLHHIQDRTVGMVRYEVTERFSFFCGAPTLQPNGFIPDRTFVRSGNLYNRKYQYEAAYWKQFQLAVEHPLPEEVAQPFSGKVPLDEQFRRNGE
ncbi:hypothetical protein BH09BAC1_BH09BAC1_20500 [soil metagenome]